MANRVVPYKEQEAGKKEQVAEMFDSISKRYDFLNHFLSLGIDKSWRKKAISLLRPYHPGKILDIATGTGDFAIEALSLNPDHITGIDISEGMLEIGRKKIARQGLSDKITLQYGDSENLQFDDKYFDAAIVAFGVRNFENLEEGLQNIYRVLKDSGNAVILEFSQPQAFPLKQMYNFYFNYILPWIGKTVSKDNSAYTYLPESVQAFPFGAALVQKLKDAGFKRAEFHPLTFGICTVYLAEK